MVWCLTNLCRGGAPKSPDLQQTSPLGSRTEAKAAANASDKTIVEVLPCGDVTNTPGNPQEPGSPPAKPEGHGFAVNQVNRKQEKEDKQKEDGPRLQLVLDVFGYDIHRGLGASAWDDRAAALAAARKMCEQRQLPVSVPKPVFLDACCKLSLIVLQDRVMPVYLDGLEFIQFLFGELFTDYQSEASEVVTANLEQLLQLIINKAADRNARSLDGTRQALVFLARCGFVGCTPVMAHIFSPVQNHKERATIRGRLDLIEHMINEFGFGKASTITMQLVMGFVRPHLDAADEKVRRAAVEVTVNCYKHKGDRTLKYITNVKPALMKLLHQRFAEVDKPSKNRKQAQSALAPVRGKPKRAMPKRESASQPINNVYMSRPVGVESPPQSMGDIVAPSRHIESTGPMEASWLKVASPEVISSPPFFQNAAENMNTENLLMPSPLSVQASFSAREEPNMRLSPSFGSLGRDESQMKLSPSIGAHGQLPGCLDHGFNDMQGLGMGNADFDLDDDLMNEIEAY